MIVFREARRGERAQEVLALCRQQARAIAEGLRRDHDAVVALLVEFGELEAAIVDALFADEDGVHPLVDAWRAAALALGHLFRVSASDAREEIGAAAAALSTELRGLIVPAAARPARLPVSEGYAWYGLYPETYLAAARRLAADRRDGAAVCIGLRSIGTSLSAVAAAGLQASGWRVASLTLRPRGHPFDRRPRLSEDLQARLRRWRDAALIVIDEGPGLSGSSFAGTAEALAGLGVADERITFLPSWPAGGETFHSDDARRRWRRHRFVHVGFEETVLGQSMAADGGRDVSAGGWRAVVYADEARHPAVQPQHERRKYLRGDAAGGELRRFAGLGRYGEAKLALAESLAEAGFAPAVFGLRGGFLSQAFVAGTPLAAADADDAFLAEALRYLEHRARQPATPTQSFDDVATMTRTNVGEALGPDWTAKLDCLGRERAACLAAPACAVDGRMLPHEWLRTQNGYRKTDGIDHHDDHFFAGAGDIAWDVAGLAVEFRLTRRRARDFAQALGRRLRDPDLQRRAVVHAVAYSAFRLGYCRLAADTLGGFPDGARMAVLARRYQRRLRAAIVAADREPT